MTELSEIWRRAAAVQARNGHPVMALMLRNEAYKLEQEAEATMGEAALAVNTGECRVCHCTNAEACDLGDGYACWWVDEEHTLCSNPKCLAEVSLDDMQAELWQGAKKARGATA